MAQIFTGRIVDSIMFKRVVESLKDIGNILSIEIDSIGISLTIIDPGHVIFANVLLNAAGLNIFKCGKPLSLHVNVAELAKIVNSCGDDTTILIEVDDQATVIKFTFDSNTSVLTFNLKCLYVHADTLRPPNSTYQCILQMKSIVFEQDIRMLHAIGRHVEVNFDNGLSMKSIEAGAMLDCTVMYKQNDPSGAGGCDRCTILKRGTSVTDQFSTQQLLKMAKSLHLQSDSIEISLDMLQPLRAFAIIPDYGHITIYVTPLVQDEHD